MLRNVIILPPFAVSAILSIKQCNLASLVQAFLAASINAKNILKLSNKFDKEDHAIAISYIISWL